MNKNFFNGIRKTVSDIIKNTSKNITEFTKEIIERATPRQFSRTPTGKPRAPTEEARKETEPEKPRILSAEGIELDVSTRNDIQRIERELEGSRKPKEIAKELGISTQKWVSIRNKIRNGDLYGDALLDRLESARKNLENSFEKFVQVDYTYTNPDGTHVQKSGEVVFFPSEERLQEKVPYGRRIKLLHTFSDAKNYWGQIGGGAEYFGIVSIGNGNYQVVDLRDTKEYNNRGKLNGDIRAQKILKNLQRGRIENEDE